jgi:type IV pilus assembly protein PilV
MTPRRPDSNLPSAQARQEGFSLVEVLVALVIMSVGLLGMAKIQALALSSTTQSRMRSLAALETASLASTMRADRNYWAEVRKDPAVTFSGGAFTVTGDPTVVQCTTYPCTPPELAWNDLNDWVTALVSVVPNAQGGVTCTIPAVPTDAPVSCQITLQWPETVVASNSTQAAAAAAASAAPNATPPPLTSYILYVDP